MSFTDDLLKIASDQVGIKEQTGHNDGQSVFVFTGGRSEAWCAHFVVWCYRTAGKPIPGDVVPSVKKANPLASVSFLESIFKDHEWHYREPKVGDVVFFKTRGASDRGPGRHTGIVERVEGTVIHTIEGNLSDSVRRTKHKLDDPRITGFGRMP
ncbi:MAG: CHAP domain-containing protein [Alphaproteobacteria bacterium]|nr:CHAP domain-containing protein [Alphaproteobacteria bacterium]